MKTKRLIDICEVYDSLHETPVYTEEGFPMVRVNDIKPPFLNISNTAFVNKDDYIKYTQKYIPKKGDILFGRVGTYNGETCLIDKEEKFCLGQNTALIHPKSIDSKYLFYIMQSAYVKEQINNLSVGSAKKTISIETIKNLEIPFGLKNERKIGKLLYTIDSKIELNNKVNIQLDNLAKTIYNYWFIQFDFPNKDGKPFKSSGGKMIWNNELNKEIPEGWNVTTLNENNYTEIIKPGINRFDGNKIYLATANVIDDKIIDDKTMITYENRETRANMQPVENSVWFAKMKNSKKIMYVGEYSTEILDNIIMSTGFLGLKCKEPLYLEYIWNFINDNNFEELKDRLSHGATQQAINNEDLSLIPLLEPDNKIIEKFHNITQNIYMRRYINEQENRELINLRDYLLPLLMNGQVQFKDI